MPLIHGDRAQLAIELDRGLVPIQHRPFQPPAAPADGRRSEPRQETAAYTEATSLGAHIEILEIDSGAADEGGEVVEEQREPDGVAVQACEDNFGVRTGTEQRSAQPRFGRLDLVLET